MTPTQREAAERLIDDRLTATMEWSRQVVALLRELLAEPRGEPGFEYKRGYEEALNDCIRNGLIWARSMFANSAEHIKPANKMHACDDPLCAVCGHGITGEPLHAHPPQQRKQISDEVVAKLINAEWATSDVPSAWKFARAVERAHGIGEPT